MHTKSRGFTIVELLIVVVILVILMTIIAFTYNGVQGRTRDARRANDIANIAKALELYYDDNGQYPVASSTDSPLGTTWYSSTEGTTNWDTFTGIIGDRIDSFPKDPKNNSTALNLPAGYSYAYYSGANCGTTAGQMYILMFRREATTRTFKSDGVCSVNPIGEAYGTNSNLSVYRVVR